MKQQWVWWSVAAAAAFVGMRAFVRRQPMIVKDTQVDREIEDSFPASDPPSWTPGTASTRSM